ncbi:unnamed protein product [Effrenium voratum]|uniref:Uncharacterized protein n=1 Tax=Effrenium voratum TaxID=2562239 RepID=A0AA36IY17_9DINO|nr:unnamed protein product [Effrenium voratum]
MAELAEVAIKELQDFATSANTQEEVLNHLKMWEGWGRYHSSIVLGPDQEIPLPAREEPDPNAVGFAYPLPPVEFRLRNSRKYPPPTDEEAFREMFKLLHYVCGEVLFKKNYVLSVIYNWINSNRRDSPVWQRGFIQAGGAQKLIEFWHEEGADQETDDDYSIHYWVLAIVGRMMGTCQESRVHLIKEGLNKLVLEGTGSKNNEIRECAVCALKGLIQHPEGREVVTYKTLIECLAR